MFSWSVTNSNVLGTLINFLLYTYIIPTLHAGHDIRHFEGV